MLDHKTWPTPAIVVSSMAHTLILGLSFLKLTKLKIDFEKTFSKLDLKHAHQSFIVLKALTILVPTSDVYFPCRLLLNKAACLIIVVALITVIILTVGSSNTHCHLKSPFKKEEELLPQNAHDFS